MYYNEVSGYKNKEHVLGIDKIVEIMDSMSKTHPHHQYAGIPFVVALLTASNEARYHVHLTPLSLCVAILMYAPVRTPSSFISLTYTKSGGSNFPGC